MGINLIAYSLKHCYLASQSNPSMNQILSHLLLAASFSFRFSFLFSFLFCRYVSHGVICLLSFSFNLLVTRSSVVSWRPGSQVISNSWSLSDLCSLSSISFNSSCYHGDKNTIFSNFWWGFNSFFWWGTSHFYCLGGWRIFLGGVTLFLEGMEGRSIIANRV